MIYGSSALKYNDFGWEVFPLPPGQKSPPPVGRTGRAGQGLNREALAAEAAEFADHNIGIRACGGIIGIDVDNYDGKPGMATLDELTYECGEPLPETIMSTSRDDGSGIRLFRIPADVVLVSALPGVEFVQAHHRYVVAPPSINPKTGKAYRWLNTTTMKDVRPWRVEDIPELPASWVEHLRIDAGGRSKSDVPAEEIRVAVEEWCTPGPMCAHYQSVIQAARDQVEAGESRHDTCLQTQVAILRYGSLRHPGGRAALAELHGWFFEVLDDREPGKEWRDGLTGAARIVLENKPTGMMQCFHVALETNSISRADTPGKSSDEEEAGIRFGTRFFAKVNNRTTFLAATLAEAVMDLGPLAMGVDGRFWAYSDGVWSPDKDVVKYRVVDLLGEVFKINHATAVEVIVASKVPVIHSAPIKEVINFRNGLLYWETGELKSHDSEILSTIQLGTEWDPHAQCPEFGKFLDQVIPEDMIDLMWELIGYLMYSGNPLHKAVMCTGTGRNGKGTWIRTMKHLLGGSNITAQSLQALASERFALASLFGKLANLAGDIDGTYMEHTARFKGITGEDMVTAEFKNRDAFEFTPYAVPVFSANKIPGSADVTTGYLSRWVVVPFPHDFTGREDRHLEERLSHPDEIQGIAARAVPALRRLMARGNFPETESGKAAMAEFMQRVDQVQTWLDELGGLGDHPFAKRTDLYSNYKRWAEEGNYGRLKASEFYDRLRSAGAQDITRRGVRGFTGVSLVVDQGDDPWKGAEGAGEFPRSSTTRSNHG